MIARVRTIRLAPGGLTQAIAFFRGEEVGRLRQVVGWAGIIVLASLSDSASGERLEIVTLWDNAPTLTAYIDGGDRNAQVAQAMPPMIAPVGARIYDVALAAGMHGATAARFIAVHLNPGNIDAVVARFENVVMHAATEQHGFRRGLLLVDRTNDNALSIGLWQTEADLIASERTGYLVQQIGNFTQIVADPIVPETLIVAYEE